LERAGFVFNFSVSQYTTFRLCLIPTLDELRQNLVRKWRQALGRAERFPSLDLEYGNSDEYYDIAINIYKEMHGRKQFSIMVDMEKQGLVQKDLPESLKMKILICRINREPIAALGWSTIGDTGLPLIAATGDKALSLSTNASNLLWWKMIADMKEQGCKYCDVGGVDQDLNPGGYKFKRGLVGAICKEENHVGQYVLYNNLKAYLLFFSLNKVRLVQKKLSNFTKQ
jgi:lipid II:glycine glycyltransferase (peptidoglycan interpeptide bridge formation enzyme)